MKNNLEDNERAQAAKDESEQNISAAISAAAFTIPLSAIGYVLQKEGLTIFGAFGYIILVGLGYVFLWLLSRNLILPLLERTKEYLLPVDNKHLDRGYITRKFRRDLIDEVLLISLDLNRIASLKSQNRDIYVFQCLVLFERWANVVSAVASDIGKVNSAKVIRTGSGPKKSPHLVGRSINSYTFMSFLTLCCEVRDYIEKEVVIDKSLSFKERELFEKDFEFLNGQLEKITS